MSVAITTDLIQTGIRTAGASWTVKPRKVPAVSAYPLKADTADLPLILTRPAEATWHTKGIENALRREDREYEILVFVEPLGQSELPARLIEAMGLLQDVKDWILSTPALSDPTNYGDYQVTLQQSEASPHSDGGIVPDLLIGGVAYHGFRVRARVRELWS